MARRGIRMIGGQEYMLAGRSGKVASQEAAKRLRGHEWAKVRVIPWPPCGELTDDYGLWVHARLPLPLTEAEVRAMFEASDKSREARIVTANGTLSDN